MAPGIPAPVLGEDFRLIDEVSYLNQASLGLVPDRAVARIWEYDEAHLGRGNHGLDDAAEAAILGEVRTAAAGLLKTKPLDLAIASGATEVLGQVRGNAPS